MAYGGEAAAAAAAPSKAPRKRKRAVAAAAADESSILPAPVRFDQNVVHESLAHAPVIERMTTLLKEHPHTAQDSASREALSKLVAAHQVLKPSVLPVPKSTLLREQLHYDASQSIPCLDRLLDLRSAVAAHVPTRRLHTDLPPQAQTDHGIRMQYMSIPIRGAAHESRLLRQSGTFVYPDRVVVEPDGTTRPLPGRTIVYPPCMMGRECIGHRGEFTRRYQDWPDDAPGASLFVRELTEPIVLMRSVSPEEWERLLAQPQEMPAGQAPCVLCHRFALGEYVHFVRLMNSMSLRIESENPDEVAQLWANKVQCEDGYFEKYILKPAEQREIMVQPIAEMSLWPLRAYRDKVVGQWRVDQSAMIWKPPQPLEAHAGETLAHF